jgi:pimeloyl-ACP methyl ester carboxylesterase
MPFCAELFYRHYDGGARSFVYPTILIHGLGGTHLSWPSQVRRINGQHMYAVDLPGHGLSEISAHRNVKPIAQKVYQFMSSMGIYSANIAGFSLGGAVAYALAQAHPNRIRSLTLIATGNRFNHTERLCRFFKPLHHRREAMELLMEVGFAPQTPKNLRRKVLEPLNRVRQNVLFADCSASQNFKPAAFSEKAKFPVFLLAGGEDQISPVAEVRKLKQNFSDVRMEIIPDAGHMLIFEQPQRVKEMLAIFLKENTAPEY